MRRICCEALLFYSLKVDVWGSFAQDVAFEGQRTAIVIAELAQFASGSTEPIDPVSSSEEVVEQWCVLNSGEQLQVNQGT